MSFPPTASDRLLSIHLTLGQYPILSSRIRTRMRSELQTRGIIQADQFEREVREKAIASQKQEGLEEPYEEEPDVIWGLRMERIRDQLTDLTFGTHLPFDLFEQIVAEVLSERGVNMKDLMLSMNPELAPIDLVFEQAMTIERLPAGERVSMEARLQESKVVLIRSLISDQLRYINIAKEWFTVSDLAEIRRRKIGPGRIGGKAAGMLLAYRVLRKAGGESIRSCLRRPDSYYIGSDLMYSFMSINGLVHWNDQKYKSETDMRAEYPQIVEEFAAGAFPPDIMERLHTMLLKVGGKPLIVRSSSLLEDNFGTSFAGKYDSIFCPNQGTLEQNLKELTKAIARVYASTLNPNALLYRRSRGLQDYDERMAVLLQLVVGEQVGDYFFPPAAGVAFSRNLYRWAPQIKMEDGFLRLVWGLGTRAVDRVGNDYPRLVALSHPLLRPSSKAEDIRRYSQQYIDVIDLRENVFKTLPIQEVMQSDYRPLRLIAQMDGEGYFATLRARPLAEDITKMVLTFDELLRRTTFAPRLREILHILEANYHTPVDLEFALEMDLSRLNEPDYCIDILQCRPQSRLVTTEIVPLPVNLAPEDVVFSTNFMAPQGLLDGIETVLFVPPEGYFALPTMADRSKLARAIGQLNAALKGKCYIAVGPGRWGNSNADLGVPIDYGDIYNTRALVELSGKGIGPAPEPSLGTHFFQDLLESQIFPLAILLDDPENAFNRDFFYNTPNRLRDFLKTGKETESTLRLIQVGDFRPKHHLRLVMNEEKNQAVAWLAADTVEEI